MDKLGIGIIGCGNISSAYLKHGQQFPVLDFRACADLRPEAAQAQAKAFNVPKACSVEELLADPAIDLVINLTIPAAHVQVAMDCLKAGKHVYSEKPLGVSPQEAAPMLEEAARRKLRVGCAPDTFLGTSHQACRKLIDDGAIGRPIAASALMLGRGHESWHPSPAFYYKPGGGPMFDMGPYYITALLNLLGPVRRVSGSAGIQINPRVITSEPLKGQLIEVETPDHVSGTMDFASGAIATITTSFATCGAIYDRKHPIIVFGTEGALQVPDPNGFDGTVLLQRLGEPEYQEVAIAHTHPNGRSLGVADMAHAILDNRPHRANGELAYDALCIMQGFLDAASTGTAQNIKSNLERPAMIPTGVADGLITR